MATKRFSDSSLEESFLREYRRSGVRFAQMAFFAGSGMALAFAMLMSSIPPADLNHDIRQIVRILLSIVLGAIGLFAAASPEIVRRHYLIIIGVPAAFACLTVAMLGFLPTEAEFPRSGRLTIAMCLACFLVYGFGRLPASMSASIGIAASIVAVIASVRNGDDNAGALIVYLSVTNIAGMILSLEIERRERELFRRAVDLAAAQKKLEETARASLDASMAKSHVLAAVSHDLRQPLTSMSLYLSLAKLNRAEPNAQGERALSQMGECIAAMTDNLSRLSNVAELQDLSFQQVVAPVDLAGLLRRLASVYAGQAAAKGVHLIVHEMGPTTGFVESNGARLWEVLANLTSNAIKFSCDERPGWVLVRGSRIRGSVRITIRDNGIGIDPSYHRRIFDEYFQIGNPQRDRERGYGLGLSIVRETISRLPGHELRLSSKPGVGTRFDIVVPLSDSNDPLPGADSGEAAFLSQSLPAPFARTDRLQGCYALVVEDDPLARKAIVETMEGWGMLVDSVGSLDEALAAVRHAERLFDVVVSDFHLSGNSDGLGVIDSVRHEQGQQTPAIIVSGNPGAIDGLRLRKTQAKAMSKPVDPALLRSELLACVES